MYPDVLERFSKAYPDIDVSHEAMQKNLKKDKNFADVVYNNHIVYP